MDHHRFAAAAFLVVVVFSVAQAEPEVTMGQLSRNIRSDPEPPTPIQVTLYYESLCPDSVNFIKDELYPTWLNLAQFFAVDWVPYGKATHRKSGGDSYTFRCQHGSLECRGNMIQACALSVLSPADSMRWIHCAMSSPEPHTAGRKCSTDLEVSYEPIDQCVQSALGKELLAAYGDRTHALKPRLTFVPTVTFNGVFDRDLQRRSVHLGEFKGVICGLMNVTQPLPDVCNT